MLRVINQTKGETLLRLPTRAGFDFSTQIRHSVQLTPVVEYYRIDASGELVVTGTALRDLGWGMPSTESASVRIENGVIIFENVDRRIGTLRFRVSHIAEPMLILGGRRIDLRIYLDDGDLMVIDAPMKSSIGILFGGSEDVF